jgi:hypothetical protein
VSIFFSTVKVDHGDVFSELLGDNGLRPPHDVEYNIKAYGKDRRGSKPEPVSRAEAERPHPEVYGYGDPEDTYDYIAGPS